VAASRASREPVSRGQLALKGNDLAALGVPPGRRVGEVLDLLLDRVLADPSLNTPERLAAIVRSL
jgi:tRNA nucleotidyltransferase (CCA-adding enzyme)